MNIEFNQTFKRLCSKAFQYSVYFGQIMENVEKGNTIVIRKYMDQAIDELQLEINQHIGQDEHSIHNARIDQLKLMYESWYCLLDIIDSTLDKQNDVLRRSIN